MVVVAFTSRIARQFGRISVVRTAELGGQGASKCKAIGFRGRPPSSASAAALPEFDGVCITVEFLT